MFFSNGYINRLRIISFWLFFVPLCGLIFSLLLNNLLIEFKFSSKLSKYNVSLPKTIKCNYENFYCLKNDLTLPVQNFETLDNCNKYEVGTHYLRDGKIVKVSESLYYSKEIIEPLIESVKKHIEEHGEIDAPSFKELTGLTRKFSIPILEYLDREKITMRIGDKRILRKKVS